MLMSGEFKCANACHNMKTMELGCYENVFYSVIKTSFYRNTGVECMSVFSMESFFNFVSQITSSQNLGDKVSAVMKFT